MKLHRRFIADRAVRTHLIVVSTPSLAFSTCFVEAQEPVGVQAFGSELAVERLDEGVVSRFAWPTEVECHAFHVRPQIEVLAHELGTVVDADRLGIAELCGAAFECFNDIVSTIALADTDCRRQPRQRIDDGERQYLGTFVSDCIGKIATLASRLVNDQSDFVLKSNLPWQEDDVT